MAWIESHQELGQHPKLRKLCRVLNISQPQAVGHLHYLWWWAVDYSESGDLTRFDALDIAIAAMWEGDPEQFVTALIQCGWIDRALDEMFIHDWAVYIGKLLDRRQKDADRKRASRGNPEPVQRTSDGHPEDGAQTAHVTLPYPTVPNQTEPNPTQPTGEGDARDARPDPQEPTAPPPADDVKPKAPERRAHRLPEDWEPDEALLQFGRGLGLRDEELTRELDKFKRHFLATGKAMKRWDLTAMNWLERSITEFAARPPIPIRSGNRVTHDDLDRAAEALKQRTGLR